MPHGAAAAKEKPRPSTRQCAPSKTSAEKPKQLSLIIYHTTDPAGKDIP
jgi:hypothetical protein